MTTFCIALYESTAANSYMVFSIITRRFLQAFLYSLYCLVTGGFSPWLWVRTITLSLISVDIGTESPLLYILYSYLSIYLSSLHPFSINLSDPPSFQSSLPIFRSCSITYPYPPPHLALLTFLCINFPWSSLRLRAVQIADFHQFSVSSSFIYCKRKCRVVTVAPLQPVTNGIEVW